MSKKRIQELMSKYKVRPNTDLDQHFCVDNRMVDEMLGLMDLKKGDIVVEIGPGLGFVTRKLAKKSIDLTVVELDNRLIPLLDNEFGFKDNVKVVNANALHYDYPSGVKIISNLPFNLAEPLLIKLRKVSFERIVWVVSEGFSKKLVESQELRKGYRVELFNLYPPTSYMPKPRTDSRVIRLWPTLKR